VPKSNNEPYTKIENRFIIFLHKKSKFLGKEELKKRLLFLNPLENGLLGIWNPLPSTISNI